MWPQFLGKQGGTGPIWEVVQYSQNVSSEVVTYSSVSEDVLNWRKTWLLHRVYLERHIGLFKLHKSSYFGNHYHSL